MSNSGLDLQTEKTYHMLAPLASHSRTKLSYTTLQFDDSFILHCVHVV